MKLLPALLLLSQIANASAPSVVIAVGYNASAPAVRLQVAADYVAIPISIQNDSKDPLKRSSEIETALRLITERLTNDPGLSIRPGVVSLSPTEQSGSKSISGYDSYSGSSAQAYILGALKPETSVFSITKRIYQSVHSVPLTDGTKVNFGKTALGLNDPEKYRSQLLGLMAKSIAETRTTLGPINFAEVTGLENPVSVMQISESEVVLFVNHKLRIKTKGS